MKILVLAFSMFSFLFISENKNISEEKKAAIEVVVGSSFKLINDTKEKVSIYTGTGFVSLNKGASTSVGCNVGKEVRWAIKGKKGKVIFKIDANHCGKTLKLSKLI